jgi:outer membrane lipoprotein-sorting protein
MFRKMLTLLALGVLLAPVVQAQTLDEVLAKHYQAMGGLDKIKALNSMRITGTMAVGPGMEAPFTMERKRPGKSRVEFTIQGMTGIQAFDGEKTWSVMPFMGKKDPEVGSEEDNKTAQDDADFDGTLVDWKAKGHTVELVGKESVEGADTYKLKVTKKNGNVEYSYLDAETYLLVKQEGKVKRRGTELDGETTFSDYKDVDGYMQPFSMESGAKGMPQKQKMTFTKIELNVPLDDSRFAIPAGADTSKAVAKSDAGEKKDGDQKAAEAKSEMKSDAKADAKVDAKAAKATAKAADAKADSSKKAAKATKKKKDS